MKVDVAALLGAVESAVLTAATPTEAWTSIISVVDATGYPAPEAVRTYDLASLAVGLAQRFHAVAATETPPGNLTFFHLGLFDIGEPDSTAETVGVYIAGGTGDPAEALSRGDLTYRPNGGGLESAFLNLIRAAGCELGAARNVFEYGLLFGAVIVLGRFAIKPSAGTMPVTIGFDGGDYLVIR